MMDNVVINSENAQVHDEELSAKTRNNGATYSGKIQYLTIANIISALFVVLMHVNEDFWTFRNSPSWIVSNIIECISYFAVPVFFMISGVTLFDYRSRYDTRIYFKKRIQRTLIPFLFWPFVFRTSRIVLHGGASTGSTVLRDIFDFRVIGNYWFFLPLFAVYIAIPFLSLMPEEKRKRAIEYAIAFFSASALIKFVLTVLGMTFIPYFDYTPWGRLSENPA